ncbi:MAG: hypothetical protein LHW46_09040 [Candidatus Cloacimonetes bacterium]|nr:hypothetical protein [Candidatus Cloacimonadota bacterium]
MTAEEVLAKAQDIWQVVHNVGSETLSSAAGKKYLFIQGTAGGAIVDTALGDTIDEQIIGVAGDVLGGFVFKGYQGVMILSGSTLNGTSPGDMLKSTYQFIKYSDGQYWKYEKDFQTMGATGYMVVPYAKVLYTKVTNGPDVVVPDGTRPAYYQEINETTYFQYMQTKQALVNEINTAQLNTLIENSNGVLKVTMPDGTVYAQGDDIANTLVGGIKDDYLNGGAGADRLEGGNGFDRYIANNGDTISDIDGKGEVYFGGLLLTGGSKEAGQSCESDGEGKSVYKGNSGTYTLSDGVLKIGVR